MDIDEILERNYNNNGYIVDEKNRHFHHYSNFTKEAIKEIVKETLRMAAEDARCKELPLEPNKYVPTKIIDKESITNVINKIKF